MEANLKTRRNRVTDALGSPVLDRATAAALCLAIGLRINIAGPFSTALVIPVLLIPVWLSTVAPLGAKRIPILGCLAIITGLMLNDAMAVTHEISTPVTLQQITIILEVIIGGGSLVWSRETIGSAPTAFWFGLGMMGHELVTGLSSDHAWKLDLSVPVTICLLAASWWRGSFSTEIASVITLALISAANDSRSAASILGMTMLVLLWQRWRSRAMGHSTPVRVLVQLAIIGTFSYFVMQAFILEGFLGAASEARSEAQLQSSGSLLLGGRPEIGATVALLSVFPLGLGMGVVPSVGDVNVAKSGMMALNYDPNNGYVERYMFGGGIEVHSGIGDLWLRCGLVGLAFALVMLSTVIVGAAGKIAIGRCPALIAMLAIQVAWDAMFSPFYYPATQVLMVAIALTVKVSRMKVKIRGMDSFH